MIRGRVIVAVAGGALALAACTASQRQPVAADEGIQLSGTLAGRTIHVSDGAPEVVVGDCDPRDGRDLDLCVIARTIEGETLGVVIENPAVLARDIELPVAMESCTPTACDAVELRGVVELRLGTEQHRPIGGELTVHPTEGRYVADLRLELAGGGAVSGSFNVAAPGSP